MEGGSRRDGMERERGIGGRQGGWEGGREGGREEGVEKGREYKRGKEGGRSYEGKKWTREREKERKTKQGKGGRGILLTNIIHSTSMSPATLIQW